MPLKKIRQTKQFLVFYASLSILLCMACVEKIAHREMESIIGKDYFEVLGVKSFINAGLPYSTLSGSQMWPEVMEAMSYGMRHRAKYKDLHDAVGRRIAKLIGCESAMVPAGASSAITLGTAACMTRGEEGLIRQLPDTRGMRNEVIIQKAHRYTYEQAVRTAGAKLVEVESAEDLKRAINDQTGMMLFYYGRDPKGKIKVKEFITIGKNHDIPVFLDGATTVPPAENLRKIMELGCDLACFSGGKGLQGPFSAGLLVGRKDLIAAARLNASPNDGTIGRGMKVSKEELLAMMVAVEVSLHRDYDADVKQGQAWMAQIGDHVKDVPGIKTEVFIPSHADQMPRLRLLWDETKIRLSPRDLKKRLRDGEPSIEVVSFGQSGGEFHISSWMILQDEVNIVARRVRDALEKAME